ncbi:exo-beta-N-acetylmuramidase NamZ family protein [Desulfatirhabdium butyrativorans]|uniref:exo-beta-N-acetylmuramidase NamZ family protein n=1 Tax=Desulfatirhabdium butyrativorans TaxID=340467 RepID=UPI0003F6B0BD|nr:DUF1343 domain-containing protein [Desulfatirhabdium butyrativorans]
MTQVKTGLERFAESPPASLKGRRLGLLCNPASVDRRFRHAKELIANAFPGQLKALFSPQHGFFADKQDNMVESDHGVDGTLGIPIYSLYGETRIPSFDMLDPIDILIIDLQDVGTRVYTFIYTMSYCLEAAAACGKQILILDRPNPVGGTEIEGNLLEPEYASFVGRYPIPMRHGMTIAELALMFNEMGHIGCRIDVFQMAGWNRRMYFGDTGLPWVMPSPNMPSAATALVYPGQVIWEGTNVSEGRGTTLPFECFGAPFIQPDWLGFEPDHFEGAVLREIAFEPVSGKWAGLLCRGYQIHVTDARRFRPYETALQLLQRIRTYHPDHFRWKSPPYEYETQKAPIDLILGSGQVRQRLEAGEDIGEMAASWMAELERYEQMRRRFWLYGIGDASK